MSLITEGVIHAMKENLSAAIAREGQAVYGADTTLQAVFDLAIIGLNAPDDSAAMSDLRAAVKELAGWSDDHLAAHALVTNKAMQLAETTETFRHAAIKAAAVMIATLERLDEKEAKA